MNKKPILVLITALVLILGLVVGSVYFSPQTTARRKLAKQRLRFNDQKIFSQAVLTGDDRLVKLFLEAGAVKPDISWSSWQIIQDNPKTLSRKTTKIVGPILLDAALRGHVKVVRLLLDYGAEIDGANNLGLTALIEASTVGEVEVIKLLIFRGAKVDKAENTGLTALMLAASQGKVAVVEVLLKNQAQINLQDQTGSTALIHATREGELKVVRQLLQYRADVTLKDKLGLTALDWAKLLQYKEIENILKKVRAADKRALV